MGGPRRSNLREGRNSLSTWGLDDRSDHGFEKSGSSCTRSLALVQLTAPAFAHDNLNRRPSCCSDAEANTAPPDTDTAIMLLGHIRARGAALGHIQARGAATVSNRPALQPWVRMRMMLSSTNPPSGPEGECDAGQDFDYGGYRGYAHGFERTGRRSFRMRNFRGGLVHRQVRVFFGQPFYGRRICGGVYYGACSAMAIHAVGLAADPSLRRVIWRA